MIADRNVAKIDAVNEDFKTQLSVHMDWEYLLSPAPLSIGILGDLTLIASQILDFEIDKQMPESGFQYIKWPKSFRTTLVQIGHEAHHSFMTAHNNMDKIRLLTMGVPFYMKEATKILVSKDMNVIEAYLPAPLRRIKQAAEESVKLSLAVVTNFEHVMNLTMEVIQACVNTKSVKEVELADTIEEQAILNVTVTNIKMIIDELKKTKEADMEMMSRAENDMRNALKEIPTGWEIIGMDFVESISNTVTATLAAVAPIAVTAAKMSLGGPAFAASTMGPAAVAAISNAVVGSAGSPILDQLVRGAESISRLFPEELVCLVKHSRKIFNLFGVAENLKTTYSTLDSISTALGGKYDASKELKRFTDISGSVNDCPAIQKVVAEGTNIVNQLADLVRNDNFEDNNGTEGGDKINSEFKKIVRSLNAFYRDSAELKSFVHSHIQPIPNRTPLLQQSAHSNVEDSTSRASGKAIANAKMKAKMAQSTLSETRASLDRTRELMMIKNNEFIKALGEMQRLQVNELRYEEAIKLLQEGLVKLGEMKDHWTKLVVFFQKVANIIEIVEKQSLTDFIQTIETTSQRLENVHKEIILDMIYIQASKASQAISLVHDIADTYVQVSNKHILTNINQLDRFMSLDPKKSNIQLERMKLLAKCKKDSEEIVRLVVEKRNEIIATVEARAQQISNEYAFLDDVLPEETSVIDLNEY